MQATGTGYPITSSPNTASSLPAEQPIAGGGFWPDISPKAFRLAMRLDGTASAERVRAELIQATLTAQRMLRQWQASLPEGSPNPFLPHAGDSSLIDGNTPATHHYTRAVYCFAAANLQERYRSFDATAQGHARADVLDLTIDELRRDAHWALADLTERTRCTVDLI